MATGMGMGMGMSSSILVLVILLPLLSHARDSQFFNKAAVNTQQPEFQPENDNAYGLYGHETGQLPPSTTQQPTNHKYLPKNYNPVAYVTVPEGTNNNQQEKINNKTYNTEDVEEKTNNNQQVEENEIPYKNVYYNNQQLEETESPNRDEEGNYYNNEQLEENVKGNYYNNEQLDENVKGNYYNNEQLEEEVSPNRNIPKVVGGMGMSDTRTLEHGRYHYNINSGTYSANHPYRATFHNNNAAYAYDQLNNLP